MSMKKIVVPVALFALTVSGVAFAEKADIIEIYNKDPIAHTIEYRVGNFADCDKNTEHRGTPTIPAKSVYTLKIKGEPFACIRRPGGKWSKSDLRGKNAKVRLQIDD